MRNINQFIESPLREELASPGSFKDFEWHELLQSVFAELRSRRNTAELHELMQPFYSQYVYADANYVNASWPKKRFIYEVMDNDPMASVWLRREVKLMLMTQHWIDGGGRDTEFRELLALLCRHRFDCSPEFQDTLEQVTSELKRLGVVGTRKGEVDAGNFLCLLHGFVMIMLSGKQPEEKEGLLQLFFEHWNFLRYIYSVMLTFVVGCKLPNFASVANTATNTTPYAPYLHLLHAPLKERFDELCQKGTKRDKLQKSLEKLEKAMREATPGMELDELCNILFTADFSDVLKRHRIPSYSELEREMSRIRLEMQNTVETLNQQVKELASQLSNAVKAAVPIAEIETELLSFRSGEALEIYKQLNMLLVGNAAWSENSRRIRDLILEKQHQELQMSMTITAQAGAYVNGMVQQQANYGLQPNPQIPNQEWTNQRLQST